jgi:LmbE family N-acetylglucosaminyl deacetylase
MKDKERSSVSLSRISLNNDIKKILCVLCVLCVYVVHLLIFDLTLMKKTLFIFVALTLTLHAQPQPNAVDLQLAVNKLSVVGSVLYVAAHPDDENTALLSYLAKGRLYRTAYLSITRGEGGQNLVGSEQGVELGVIRTQELLAARRVDGAEQFFTRAIDFGYSKSSEEALRLWNKDSVLKDVVWVIRTFRPDIIITRFTPTQGGHGHHLASAILAEEAFKISGDPSVFPEQLALVQPWKAKRLLFNHFSFGGNNSNPQNLPTLKVDVGEYNPLLGKSYTELSGISRTMHKSQAMGSAQNKGTSINNFVVTAGAPANNDIFEGVDATWNRFPNGKKLAAMAAEVKTKFNAAAPERSIPSMLKFYKELQKVNYDPLINRKMNELESVIRSCAGLSIEAFAEDPDYSRNDSIRITMTFLNRSSSNVSVSSAFSPELNIQKESKQQLKYNEPLKTQLTSIIRPNERYSQPYWLTAEPKDNRYRVYDQSVIGKAENPPILYIAASVTVDNEPMVFTVPVQYKWIDDLQGEKQRNVEVIPPVSVSLVEKNVVWHGTEAKQVNVRLHASKNNVKGVVSLNTPIGWNVTDPHPFTLVKKGAEADFTFTVTPDSGAHSGELTAEAEVGEEIFRSTLKHIDHEHIPYQPLLVNAESNALKMDIKKKGSTVGYIMGAGDEVPKALRQMGYEVSLLSDADLLSGDLSRFDAVIAGVRAYNTREQLRLSQNMVLNYVEQGGTYIVQYQVLERGQTDNLGPLPLTISRNRVTDEYAAMKFVRADHPLLNSPNRITAKDFKGWVQERGLYFASAWDPKYEPILSCADPNEQPQEGSLLYAKIGKGVYIFTGLSFFRQLPAGVEGAYRLFANLVSAGK